MPFALQPRQTVVFVGDSITDCGRRGANPPLGEGYVKAVKDLIDARYPAHQLQVINSGIGGNTVRDLANRWQDDVLRYYPDWVSVKIGINDVHLWMAQNAERSVSPQQFRELYDGILARVKQETGAQLILIDPFYISTETAPGTHRARVLQELPAYIDTVAAMAEKYDARRVRTHELFQEALRFFPPDRFCPEPVHPHWSGHLLIAQAWLAQMGY